MYAVLGVPEAVIWAGATFIVALIPIFGTFMVWGPVADPRRLWREALCRTGLTGDHGCNGLRYK